jgi:hypothetical protein
MRIFIIRVIDILRVAKINEFGLSVLHLYLQKKLWENINYYASNN